MSTLLDNAQPETTAIAARQPDPFVEVVERLAANKDVDVEKLRALLDMQERVINRNAKAAFDEAFSRMWPEMPEIDERGRIKNKDGSTKSHYAKYEDIQAAVRTILAKFGFAMRHRTEFPSDKSNIIRIVGILSGHGHSEESSFEAPPDKNDYRSAIQDQGSTVSYGKRYTTCDLLNIITRGVDNDGRGAKKEPPKTPDGYQEWLDDMTAVADNGLAELQATWNKSKPTYRDYITKNAPQTWANLKTKASKVGQ